MALFAVHRIIDLITAAVAGGRAVRQVALPAPIVLAVYFRGGGSIKLTFHVTPDAKLAS